MEVRIRYYFMDTKKLYTIVSKMNVEILGSLNLDGNYPIVAVHVKDNTELNQLVYEQNCGCNDGVSVVKVEKDEVKEERAPGFFRRLLGIY